MPETAQNPRVALVGRPNVGKSTLFNRLVGRREAIVHNRPGVTRDRLERRCEFLDRKVILEDTGGIDPGATEEMAEVVTRQALGAVAGADAIVFVIDGRAGVTPLDEQVAELLRHSSDRVVLAVNKVDAEKLIDIALDGWRLGLGEPVAISAEHDYGLAELIDRVREILPAKTEAEDRDEGFDDEGRPDPELELQLALVGRPNVGKSSLVNRLAGEDRVAVSDVPGTTRDAVDVVVRREGRAFRLVDTAGLRRRSKVSGQDEEIGILLTRRRLARCHVAILVVDAPMGLTSQDVGIAGEIDRIGRPMIVALNKWDLLEDPAARLEQIRGEMQRRMAFARYAPLVSVSALSGQRVVKLLDFAREVAAAAQQRIPTADLNRFLQRTVGERLVGGQKAKMFYMTQTGVFPPRFVVFTRQASELGDDFRRFLRERLRRAFEFGPTPVVVDFRSPPRR